MVNTKIFSFSLSSQIWFILDAAMELIQLVLDRGINVVQVRIFSDGRFVFFNFSFLIGFC